MIIDIRDIGDFVRRPTSATNIPIYKLKKDFEFLRDEKEVILICTSGMKSMQLAHYLKQKGIIVKYDTIKKYYESNK